MKPEAGQQACVLIPARNEADRIGATVRAADELNGVSRIIVVDDASTDGTAALAEQAGAHLVVRLDRHAGKGGALDKGLEHCSSPILLMLDADLGDSAWLAQALLDPVLAGECDMTVAVFPELVDPGARTGGGGFGLALKLARRGIRLLTGAELAAPLSGQRALVRSIVEQKGGFGHGFAVETCLSGWAAAGGWRVREIPVAMKHRRTAKDVAGMLHRAKQLLHIAQGLVWLAINRGRARRAADA